MENFPSNAHQPKIAKPELKTDQPEEPRAQPVVTGTVVRRKKSPIKKFTEMMFGDTKGIGSAVVMEILLPAMRDMVFEAGKDAMERTLYPDARGSGYRRGISSNGHVNYRAMSGGLVAKAVSLHQDARQPLSRRARSTHNFDEIVLASRREGEDVLAQMFGVVERFEVVTVADLYEMVKLDTSYVDRKFGWNAALLASAGVSRVKEGYLLDLPRPAELD